MMDTSDGILSGRDLLFERSKERAYSCLNEGEYSRAFAHMIVALTIQPDADDVLLDLFFYTLDRVANDLEVQQNWNELLLCYQQSLEVLPYSSHILHGLATVLFRLGHIESATSYFQKAYRENPFFTPSLYCADNIKNVLVERWHFLMLNDRGRNSAYSEAICRAVKDGYDVVLDIGAGTGILSMIAADAGAKKVYACEGNQVMFSILQKVIEANSKKNIQLLQKFSHDFVPGDLPEKVTLVVTEIFDAGLLGEHALKTIKHAWEHLIKKDDEETNTNSGEIRLGKVIPHSAAVWAVPIECERLRDHYWLNKSASKTFGLDNRFVNKVIDFEPYTTEKLSKVPGGYKCLSSPKLLFTVNFNDIEEVTSLLAGKSISIKYETLLSGQIDAIALWFDLNLDEFVKISTSPQNYTGCWEQCMFCVQRKHLQNCSPHVNINDEVELNFLCQGHLTLERVITPSLHLESELQNSISMDPYVIQSLNSYFPNVIVPTKVFEADSSVIDISPFPVVGLRALKGGAGKLTILPSKFMKEIMDIQKLCGISNERIKIVTYEDICAQAVQFSALLSAPVEMCGLLKKNIFEDIALLRTLSQKASVDLFPRKISIYALLIESPDLFEQAKLISDENCLGYKISHLLNAFQSVIYQDLELSALSYEPLCDAIKLCDIALDKLCLEKNKLQSFVEFRGSSEVPITKSGRISAVPFWFSLEYDENCSIDTLSSTLLWKQAAVIPETEITVCDNDKVQLEWTCRNSCLNICVKK